MKIKLDDLQSPQVQALLSVHLNNAAQLSPADSVFALDLSSLCQADITFWTAWQGNIVIGFGAIKELDKNHGEIKSMHTLAEFRGKGVASQILSHLIDESKTRNYQKISLETGTVAEYKAAHKLYQKFGFIKCQAFANYEESENSIFMTLQLID